MPSDVMPDPLESIIRSNTIRTGLLIVGFPLVVPLIVTLTVFVACLFAGRPDALRIATQTFVIALLGMLVVQLLWLPIGYFLSQWIIDAATGARVVERSELPRVWSLLDRLSARAGLRTPSLRLIETDSLNAYASGLSEAQYAVTVTSGLLDLLDDDELEGVLAHELAHMLHHDVRLLVVATVLVGTVPLLHDVIMKVYWAIIMGILNIYRAIFTLLPIPAARAMVELSYVAVYWVGKLVAYAVGFVAMICSLCLHFAISRRREFMADAQAAVLTGKPWALASALRKISGNATLDTVVAAVRAMCIEQSAAMVGLFSTHPPVSERIAALEGIRPVTVVSAAPVQTGQVEPTWEEAEASPLPEKPTVPDEAAVLRYRQLLTRGGQLPLDRIEREHLYRRAHQAIERAQSIDASISDDEVSWARTCLEAAIEELEREVWSPPARR